MKSKRQRNRIILVLLSLLSVTACHTPKDDGIVLKLDLDYGNYQIGMLDTVIFKEDEIYTFENYKGGKPFLIKIWYPSEKTEAYQTMYFSELFTTEKNTNASIKSFRDTFNTLYLNYIMEYGILKNIGQGDNPAPSPMLDSAYAALLAAKTKTIYNAPKAPGRFPTVLYHHGYEAWGHDNYLLAEYLASHGYVVVTTNFEWLYSDNDFDEGNENIRFMLDFISKSDFMEHSNLYAIGHSWGAQALLYFDKLEEKPFQSIFSLHTTIEHVDTVKIPKWWPELFAVLSDTSRLTTPSYIFSPERPSNNFWAYRLNKNADFTYINAQHPITHEGFISLENFRYFLRSNYVFSDDSLLVKQFKAYQEINRYILDKLNGSEILKEDYQRIYELSE